jgi:glycosyltransferase involved in cell wall biosynthesis
VPPTGTSLNSNDGCVSPPDPRATGPMVSVIICTRNRSASLLRTMESVRNLRVSSSVEWELVVVDNNSIDDTSATVKSFAASSGLSVRYVFEAGRGLSRARNAGLRVARGEIIAFTDDDMLVEPDWLMCIVDQCGQHPTVPVFFGQTHVMRSNQPKLAIREGDIPVTYQFPCAPNEPGSGNNMILRRGIVSSLGEFDTSLGAGTKLGSSEDTDFSYRVLYSGAAIRYCPEIVALHDHDRLSPAAVRSLLFVYGRGRGGFFAKYMIKRDWWVARLCYWELRSFFRLLFRSRDTLRAAVHLAGLTTGFAMRLAMEIEASVKDGAAAAEIRGYSPLRGPSRLNQARASETNAPGPSAASRGDAVHQGGAR